MRDGIRLALGTLTIFPTSAPRVVDRRAGSWAMTFAPVVGVLLAVVPALVLWLLDRSARAPGPTGSDSSAAPLLAAVLVVATITVLTRAMHLDGLADTVDGLGSGRPGPAALEVMRRGDIGPFGVATMVLVLLLQVSALAVLVDGGQGPAAVAVALVTSRLVLPMVCSRGVPAARPDGLGHAVAGSVGRAQLLLAAGVAGSVLVLLTASGAVPGGALGEQSARAGLCALAGLLAAGALCWRCVRRLGGVTGDVMGACVETAFTTTLVVWALG